MNSKPYPKKDGLFTKQQTQKIAYNTLGALTNTYNQNNITLIANEILNKWLENNSFKSEIEKLGIDSNNIDLVLFVRSFCEDTNEYSLTINSIIKKDFNNIALDPCNELAKYIFNLIALKYTALPKEEKADPLKTHISIQIDTNKVKELGFANDIKHANEILNNTEVLLSHQMIEYQNKISAKGFKGSLLQTNTEWIGKRIEHTLSMPKTIAEVLSVFNSTMPNISFTGKLYESRLNDFINVELHQKQQLKQVQEYGFIIIPFEKIIKELNINKSRDGETLNKLFEMINYLNIAMAEHSDQVNDNNNDLEQWNKDHLTDYPKIYTEEIKPNDDDIITLINTLNEQPKDKIKKQIIKIDLEEISQGYRLIAPPLLNKTTSKDLLKNGCLIVMPCGNFKNNLLINEFTEKTNNSLSNTDLKIIKNYRDSIYKKLLEYKTKADL